jgi:ubiquitin C-terminal hydrolase
MQGICTLEKWSSRVCVFILVKPGGSLLWNVVLCFFFYSCNLGNVLCNFRYCPSCKQHRQASKKLDLWRLPEILVIHLKRFSYTHSAKNKLETYVDFPVDDLDLSTHLSYKNGQLSHRYMLYAISNHYGSMGGGHYTAFIHVSDVFSPFSISPSPFFPPSPQL